MNKRTGRPSSPVRRQILATIIATHGTVCAVKGCGVETIVGGSPSDPRTFNLGHVVADCNGGKWSIDNLLPICRRCNEEMGEHDWPADMMTVSPVNVPLLPDPGPATRTPGPLANYWG